MMHESLPMLKKSELSARWINNIACTEKGEHGWWAFALLQNSVSKFIVSMCVCFLDSMCFWLFVLSTLFYVPRKKVWHSVAKNWCQTKSRFFGGWKLLKKTCRGQGASTVVAWLCLNEVFHRDAANLQETPTTSIDSVNQIQLHLGCHPKWVKQKRLLLLVHVAGQCY